MKTRELFAWLALAAAAVLAIGFLLPRAVPFLLLPWRVTPLEAEVQVLARAADLGELPAEPYVVTLVETEPLYESSLMRAGVEDRSAMPQDSPHALAGWQVVVYAKDALPFEWSYRGTVSWDGRLVSLRRLLPEEASAPEVDAEDARARADAYLKELGFDLSRFAEPETRSRRLAARTDLTIRYALRDGALGDVPNGVQVHFLGDELAGFSTWLEPADERVQTQLFQQTDFVGLVYLMGAVILLVIAIVPFVRKYHEGEIGVRRSTQLFLVFFGGGILAAILFAPVVSQYVGLGAVPRRVITLLIALWTIVFMVLPLCLLGALSWAVGEAAVRERAGRKLASFDGLMRGHWGNATVARAALRGTVLGLALLGVLLTVIWAFRRAGFPVYASLALRDAMFPVWPGAVQILWDLGQYAPALLAATLLIGPLFRKRLGLRRSLLVGALVAWPVLFPWLLPLPITVGVVAWAIGGAAVLLVFAFTDLLTALLCGLVAQGVFQALPLLGASDPWLQLQGCIPLLVLGLPLLGSLRHVQSKEELTYVYEDVPPHVRRIAERERQRVELETAREIQASILPELPPQLAGIELAHAYQPATEVGGDFYEVLALEDGRLAVAVGDVAGHGVSSGLVMSMVKSALAVQVTFDPDVSAVLKTLNRMVYQSARRRLLTTLSYAIVDPRSREMVYASAGHIFPYRVTSQGRVYELEAGEYPLGVRPDLAPPVRRERLDAGDYVVLLSDGLVERTPEGSDEPFGFDRLRDSLARHAADGNPHRIVRGLLQDLEDHTGTHPRDDDMTVLVLRLPAA